MADAKFQKMGRSPAAFADYKYSGTWHPRHDKYTPDASLSSSAVIVESDEDLVARMRRGDEQAFTALYTRRRPDIHRFVRHLTGSRTMAEEITQEVFLAMIRQVDRFNRDRGTVIAYLYAIARRLTDRALREERRSVPLVAPELIAAVNHTDSDEAIRRAQMVNAVKRLMMALPLRYRETLVLCDMQGLDYETAAQRLDCPIGTVRSRLHRARTLLLQRLRAAGLVDLR